MTVRELIEDLQRLSPDREVCVRDVGPPWAIFPGALVPITLMCVDVDSSQCDDDRGEPRYVISFET